MNHSNSWDVSILNHSAVSFFFRGLDRRSSDFFLSKLRVVTRIKDTAKSTINLRAITIIGGHGFRYQVLLKSTLVLHTNCTVEWR